MIRSYTSGPDKKFLCSMYQRESLFILEFRESDVSPGKTEVKQGKFVEFISPAKVFF